MRNLPKSCRTCETYGNITEEGYFVCIHPGASFQYNILKTPGTIPKDCPLRKEGVMQQGRESRQQEIDREIQQQERADS
jgi:hypothetical protein